MGRKRTILMTVLALSAAFGACAYAAEESTIQDKVIAGYQAWFNTEGDGSPRNNKWVHWGTPEPGKLTFEAYPDVRDYSDNVLKPTRFAKLGSGEVSKLFSSYPPEVIDKHFEIMRDYGIDGVAVQRFGANTIIGNEESVKNYVDILKNVRASAEKYNRLFYVMYDISGLTEENIVSALEEDWQKIMLDELDITASSAYAREGDKPVVCLWGLGIRSGTPEQYSEIIDWFHDKGCYVIGGVSKGWRESSKKTEGMEDALCKLDMISPWAVGSMKTDEDIDSSAKQYIAADKAYLDEKGIAYQPVMFPGFSWSNWKPDAVRNQIPRRAGEFMWRQAYDIAKQGITCGYIAMFDEYDEGTAILKLAEDSSMVPKDQYFITASADGIYTSSDLYLRLAGYITKALRGEAELTEKMPVPLSEGPVYFRSGFEKGLDAQPTDDAVKVVKDELSYNGRYSVKLTGSGTRKYRIADLQIAGKTSMSAGISAYLAEGDANVKIGFEASDGSVVYSDVRLEAQKWVQSDTTSDISGKEITGLVVTAEGNGDYKLYLDDMTVTEDSSLINKSKPGSKYDLYARSLYNLGLLEGESSDGFKMQLENAVTREQAVKAVMGVLGEKTDSYAECPFTDLSEWSVPYVAKAYEKGIVKGADSTSFNASGIITKREAAAILLRALGYPGDAYNDCAELAVESGLFKDKSMTAELDAPLTYDDLIFLSYRALFACPHESDTVLLGSLLKDGVFTNAQFNKQTDMVEEYNSMLKPPASITFNSDYFYNLMNITINNDSTKGDSYTRSEVKDGVSCIYVPENQFMYCQISDGYITPEDNCVKVTITYLDEGRDGFGFHYNSEDASLEGIARDYKECSFAPRTDTGEWKTQSVIIDDAAFNNKQNSGADMRVFGPDLHIREISVEKLTPADK